MSAVGMNAMWTQLDADIVGYFNPLAKDPAMRAPVRNGWPLHRLDHAVAICIMYLVGVIACKFLFDKPKKDGEKKDASEKKSKVSVSEKIEKDGLVIFVAMVIYNATQVALCGWMVVSVLMEHRRRGLRPVCNAHNLAEDGIAAVLHVFYLSKALDFADTVFMIVKSNWRQVSFLHVYHHSSIWLFYWLNTQCNYDSDIYFTIVLNGTIHFIMYGYYLATTFNIPVPAIIKKTITNAQITQFFCMEIQGAALLILPDCGSPKKVTILYMVYISTMVALFMNFKNKNYKPSKSTNGSDKPKDSSGSVAVKRGPTDSPRGGPSKDPQESNKNK
jgi:elongation of very long chain fatty acids protein 4